MADLGKNLKNILVKSMEAIGNTASNIASNTKYKVDEMNLLNRKREILNDFGAKAYAIWEKEDNPPFPDELKKDLEELCRIDNQLVDMRAEHYSGQNADLPAEKGAETTAEDAEAQEERQPADTEMKLVSEDTVPAEESAACETEPDEASAGSVTEAIDSLFDASPAEDSGESRTNDPV